MMSDWEEDLIKVLNNMSKEELIVKLLENINRETGLEIIYEYVKKKKLLKIEKKLCPFCGRKEIYVSEWICEDCYKEGRYLLVSE
jgi:predicted regulator of amino acid metabolism with ACT domain